MSSPTDANTQNKMVEAVTDHQTTNGTTKAPAVPVAEVHVTDVESRSDPQVDNGGAQDVVPSPVDEIPTAFAQKKSFKAEMLAEVNQNQES